MPRTGKAWWLAPGMGSSERASYLLHRYNILIVHKIRYYEHTYPYEIDWEPIVWDAAYRASFRVDGNDAGFIPLFNYILWRRSANFVARHARRREKLTRHPSAVLDSISW